uniref:AlNc14C1049G12740 protein n=1 Tax=Albugo laibachii Nc14 TaxID=890382 RepID=F0X2G6_9STRA|nr:AlNc14C1049G12740 [Albugo laibachii Nc14]|eukprot:CCA28062.1 AlNc14C1049G12740 [Albugo laibachii Nc14]
MRKRALRFIRPRSGIVRAHLTCDKQIWSFAHLLKPTESVSFSGELMTRFVCHRSCAPALYRFAGG